MKLDIKDMDKLKEDVEVVLLDIEGTTTSISFVKEVLFPYVRRELRSYLTQTWWSQETQKDLKAIVQQVLQDVSEGLPGAVSLPPLPLSHQEKRGDEGENDEAGNKDRKDQNEGRKDNTQENKKGIEKNQHEEGSSEVPEEAVDAVVDAVEGMMDADRKVGALKTLQGNMWRRAYQEGQIQGHVYADVPGMVEEWRDQGLRVAIYSSGSVQAQKLLFKHSCRGDMLGLFEAHFDTLVGPKVETDSYSTIAQRLNCRPHNMLFLTDLAREAYAAREAGVKVVLSVREGTAPLSPEDVKAFPTITSFRQLDPTTSPNKRAKTA